MKNSRASAGKLVILKSVTDIDLEATEEYNLLSTASSSFKEIVNTRLQPMLNSPPRDEME